MRGFGHAPIPDKKGSGGSINLPLLMRIFRARRLAPAVVQLMQLYLISICRREYRGKPSFFASGLI
jgi:hypothetical protein